MDEEIKKRLGQLEEAIDALAEALKGEGNPVSPVCKTVLGEEITKDRCYDFREVRRLALCKAWEIMEKERVPFRTAISSAWDWVKRQCYKVSAWI